MTRVVLAILLAASEVGQAASPPESDRPEQAAATMSLLAGISLHLEPPGRLSCRHDDDSPETFLALDVVGLPSVDTAGTQIVYSRRATASEGGETVIAIRRVDAMPARCGEEQILVWGGGSPDRPVLSPDGDRVVFTWGRTGIASLWQIATTGGDPEQLTNRGLETLSRNPGEAPRGFLPPPMSPPTISGSPDRLVLEWETPTGPHSLVLP